MWFLFGDVSSSSCSLALTALLYCGTTWAFHNFALVNQDRANQDELELFSYVNVCNWGPGSSCSKLTTSLVNVSLKFKMWFWCNSY